MQITQSLHRARLRASPAPWPLSAAAAATTPSSSSTDPRRPAWLAHCRTSRRGEG